MTALNSNTTRVSETDLRASEVSSAPATRDEGWIQSSRNISFSQSQIMIIDEVYAAIYIEPLPPLEETYPNIEEQLRAMASDLNIRREMGEIESEFYVADADGLDELP